MTNNPYLQQLMDQTGMSEWEAKRASRNTSIRRPLPPGFDSWDEYNEAMADFLNGQ